MGTVENKVSDPMFDFLTNRIKELRGADEDFCKDRWDMNLPDFQRGTARECSNQVTFARQELESILEFYKKTKEANSSFENSVRPLIQYLAENHHPHTKAIVTNTGAEVLEGVKTTGEISDYLVD